MRGLKTPGSSKNDAVELQRAARSIVAQGARNAFPG